MSYQLLSVLECLVCNEYMQPPIIMCLTGHCICNKCRSRLTNCPSCRACFGNTRNYALEELVENTPLPCRYGCAIREKYQNIRQHEENCLLRNDYNCVTSTCTWRGSLHDMNEHLTMHHLHLYEVPIIIPNNLKNLPTTLWLKTIQLMPCLRSERFRLVGSRVASNIVYLWVEYIGNSKKANRFEYRLKFNSATKRAIYSAKCLKFNSPCQDGFLISEDILQLSFDCTVQYFNPFHFR